MPVLDKPVTSSPPPATDVALRFRRWKEKLLDLTLRNRLLNFRVDGNGGLKLDAPDLALLEDRIFAGKLFDLLPRPITGPGDERAPELSARRVQDTADAQRLDDLKHLIVHTRCAPEEIWSHLKHLDREARVTLEEGGAAVLHLAVGFLRWFETGSADQPLLAPILLHPVELLFDPRTRRARFRRLAEEPLLNATLLERLRRDYAVDTRELEALPMESAEGAERGVDVAAGPPVPERRAEDCALGGPGGGAQNRGIRRFARLAVPSADAPLGRIRPEEHPNSAGRRCRNSGALGKNPG